MIETWPEYQTLLEIFDILSTSGESKLVGGCVRNYLLKEEINDIDIATQCTPNQIEDLLSGKYKCIPTGRLYGTITVIANNFKFEITTLRSDIKSYGRKADVEFTQDWKLDSDRRDFTINALYMDLHGNISDFHNGISDIHNKTIKFIGDPTQRIEEDYLRILRLIRFAGYFKNVIIDQDSFNAALEKANMINALSAQRIQEELKKILSSKYINQSLKICYKLQLFEILGLNYSKPEFIDPPSSHWIINLCYLLIKFTTSLDIVKSFCSRLHLSNADIKLISTLVQLTELDFFNIASHYTIHYKHGAELYSLYLELYNKTHDSNFHPQFTSSKMPVSGADLKEYCPQNEQMGKALKRLESIWCKSLGRISKQDLLKCLQNQSQC